MSGWDRIWRTRSEDWFFARLPLAAGAAVEPVAPDAAYLSAHLTSLHVVDVRVATRRFHACVTSLFTMGTRTGDDAQFLTVTTPRALRGADPAHADRIVTLDRRLLGPVPYRGGDVDVEIGLFCVPTTDLLDPYLNLLDAVTSVAGVSLLATPRALVESARAAVETLLGVRDGSVLQIGLLTSLGPPIPGYYCVVRAPRDDPALDGLRLAEDHRLVQRDGVAVEHPYLVFRLTAGDRRDDWANIPDLRADYERIRDAVRDGDLARAEHAVAVFGRAAAFSPDLLVPDGLRLRDLVGEQVRAAFPATATVGGTGNEELPEFASLALYGPAPAQVRGVVTPTEPEQPPSTSEEVRP
jgi:hypothetical protein